MLGVDDDPVLIAVIGIIWRKERKRRALVSNATAYIVFSVNVIE